MYSKYRDRAAFLFVYIQEAHPDDGWKLESNEKDEVVVSKLQQRLRHDPGPAAAPVAQLEVRNRRAVDRAWVECLESGLPRSSSPTGEASGVGLPRPQSYTSTNRVAIPGAVGTITYPYIGLPPVY